MKAHYVIDTSYLIEMYRLPGTKSNARKEITKRLVAAQVGGASFYVTAGVIHEVANHIAHVNDGAVRRRIAQVLAQDVKLTKDSPSDAPWVLRPAEELDELRRNVERFAEHYATEKVGLTDLQVAEEARQIKAQRGQERVHIWTRDGALKAREPDTEPSPFV